jgi:hypothetical protein
VAVKIILEVDDNASEPIRKTTDGLDKLEKKVNETGNAMDGFGNIVKNAFSTALGMVSVQSIEKAISGLTGFFDEAFEGEDALARLDNVLKTTANAFYDLGGATDEQTAKMTEASNKIISTQNEMQVKLQEMKDAHDKRILGMTQGEITKENAEYEKQVSKLTAEYERQIRVAENAQKEISDSIMPAYHLKIERANREQTLSFANEMQLRTKFADDEIIKASTSLSQYYSVSKDEYDRVMSLVLDVAEGTGQSVESVASSLGDVLDNPTEAVRKLVAMKVRLTDQQKEEIEGYIQTGNVASAHGVILDALEGKYKGMAETIGNTTSGKFAILNNIFNDMKENIGTALLPALQSIIEAITAWSKDPATQKFIDDMATSIKQWASSIVTFMNSPDVKNLASWLSNVFTDNQPVSAFGIILNEITKQIGLWLNSTDMAGAVKNLVDFFGKVLNGLLDIIIAWINNPATQEVIKKAGEQIGTGIYAGIESSLQKLLTLENLTKISKIFSLGGQIETLLSIVNAQPREGRASGGSVSSNTPYLVGEAGPELFMPSVSGAIIPNSKLAGSNLSIGNITVNVNGNAGADPQGTGYAISKALRDAIRTEMQYAR